MPIDEGFERHFKNLFRAVEFQVKSNIPMFTILLLPENREKTEDFPNFCENMVEFFSNFRSNGIISEQKIKVSIFGKWYKLPGRLVEELKKSIDESKEYDNFFLNFCVNYDYQEEIVDACRLIAKQVELGKLDPEMITKETIKENVYSSYLLPPDILLIYGDRRSAGLLLWDSVNSRIMFANKSFMDFEDKDIQDCLDDGNK